MYGCIKDDVVERDLLESVLVKAWYDSEIRTHLPNFISKKEIKWGWEGAERTPNSLLIQSVESKDIRSFYTLEVSAVDGYEAVIYMYNPTAPSIDGSFTGREIAFGLDGEIIYSKFLRGTEDAKKSVPKRGLLATAARFSEGNNCNPGDWCFDDDLDAFVLDEVVVTFSQSSLNNANSITIIGWSSVLSYINNNTTSSNYYGNLPTTYSSSSGQYITIAPVNVTNNLTGKADCVYGKLISSGIHNHNLITDTFLNFGDGNISGSDLIYESQLNLTNDLGQVINGKFHREGSDYIVTLNESQLNNRSPLEIARTILHESVHALLRNNYVNGPDSFIYLFGEYMNSNTGASDVTHAIMRDNYIPSIANALKQFDNYQEPDEFYDNLAWEGLHQFLSQAEINEILATQQQARNRGLNCI